jgi:polyribonucleotide nucleotidyltransferase
VLLTDIIGDEDHYGDMDFKIAGTQNGITGIQLDLKIEGISPEIIRATFDQSREGPHSDSAADAHGDSAPKQDISEWAPRLIRTSIDPEKIGLLIGPGGKNIRGHSRGYGDGDRGRRRRHRYDCQRQSRMGGGGLGSSRSCDRDRADRQDLYGRVTSIKDFGAFVEILPAATAGAHQRAFTRLRHSVGDVCRVGDEMKVLVSTSMSTTASSSARRRAYEELGLPDEMAAAVAEAGGGDQRPARRRRMRVFRVVAIAGGGDRGGGRWLSRGGWRAWRPTRWRVERRSGGRRRSRRTVGGRRWWWAGPRTETRVGGYGETVR